MSSAVASPSSRAKHEPGAVLGGDGGLAEATRERHDRLVGVLARLQAADDLDELHDRRRVHEVHADEAPGALRGRGQLGDGDAGGVRGQDGLRRQERVRLSQERLLRLLVLQDGLDEQLRPGALVERLGRVDAGEERRAIAGAHLPFLHQLREGGRDALGALLRQLGRRVDQHHVDARLRRHLRDARSHLAGADDGHPLDHHASPLSPEV
jgi:hypothetical protein